MGYGRAGLIFSVLFILLLASFSLAGSPPPQSVFDQVERTNNPTLNCLNYCTTHPDWSTEKISMDFTKPKLLAWRDYCNGYCQGKQAQQPQQEKERLPIIFVPGVAGSKLVWAGTFIDNNLWPLAPLASRGKLMLNPDGKTPAEAGVVIKATDVIRNVAYYSDVYDPFISGITSAGYTEGKDFFVFPYDWRLDNTLHLAELDTKVDEVLQKTGKSKVIIIAHSMGGLISKAYTGSLGKSKVDTLITISTPFYGAPKAYYAITNGYAFGNPTVNQNLMKILSQNLPAAYQLLPRKTFIIDSTTSQAISLNRSYYEINYKGFRDVSPGVFGDTYTETTYNDWSFNKKLIEQANSFYDNYIIDKNTNEGKPLPAGVKHYVIVGSGVKTLSWFTNQFFKPGEKSYIDFLGLPSVMEPRFADGDGTVPLWSLDLQGDKSFTAKYFIPYRKITKTIMVGHTTITAPADKSTEHTALTGNPETLAIIKQILNGTAPDSNQYSAPTNYEDTNSGMDFTLHSDAHLVIIDKVTGQKLGYNSGGGIDQTIPTGTFLSIGGVEHASVGDISHEYDVSVNGYREGNFTLVVNVTKGDGYMTSLIYSSVPVKSGSTAHFSLSGDKLSPSSVPIMNSVVNGVSSTIQPNVGVVKISKGFDIAMILIGAAVVIVAVAAVVIFTKRKK